MPRPSRRTCLVLCLLLVSAFASAQDFDANHLVIRGQVNVGGHTQPYVVQHLPPASFPQLPAEIAGELTRRGCLIPQTYAAHRPENVVRGSFGGVGSSDWAVLCAADGQVRLLVFFESDSAHPATLGTAEETQRLQAYPGSAGLGFNWGIDAASPQAIHDLRIGMWPRPKRLDHDALGDSVFDQKTVYHYFTQGRWTILETP